MKKVKLCVIDRGLYNGGAAKVIQNYFLHMDREDFELHLVVHMNSLPEEEKTFLDMGFIIHHLSPMKSSRVSKQNYLDYKSLFEEFKFDIVHNNCSGFILPTYFAAKHKVPLRILHSHNDFYRQFSIMNPIKRFISIRALRVNAFLGNAFFACSKPAAVSMFGEKRVKNGKVKYLRNAIDVGKYRFDIETRGSIRKKLDMEDCFVVGHVGRFDDKQKNQEFLIKIFYEIQKKKPLSKLLLVGDGDDIQKRKIQVESLGIKDKTIFTGNISNVNEYMQAMDAFVLPSKYEGLAIVTVEAQAAGLPLFVSDEITQETKITNNVEFYSLKLSAEEWAERIINKMKDYTRGDTESCITEAGYNIKKEAKNLKDFYINSISKGSEYEIA